MIVAKNKKNQLEKFEELLLIWNKTHNLISRSQTTNIKEHIKDSLSVSSFLGKNILDLGSGGGFPGIPIAITCPDKQVFLIERKQNKAAFLLNTTNQLGLKNTKVINNDSSELDRESFPTPLEIVTRAFGSPYKTIKAVNGLLETPETSLKLMKTHPPSGLQQIPKAYQIDKIEDTRLKGKDKKHILVTISLKKT